MYIYVYVYKCKHIIYIYMYIYIYIYIFIYIYIYMYVYIHRLTARNANVCHLCSADGSTHTESNTLYGTVKHRYRPNLSPRQRPTANGQSAP